MPSGIHLRAWRARRYNFILPYGQPVVPCHLPGRPPNPHLPQGHLRQEPRTYAHLQMLTDLLSGLTVMPIRSQARGSQAGERSVQYLYLGGRQVSPGARVFVLFVCLISSLPLSFCKLRAFLSP